jgi:hypothetical protein
MNKGLWLGLNLDLTHICIDIYCINHGHASSEDIIKVIMYSTAKFTINLILISLLLVMTAYFSVDLPGLIYSQQGADSGSQNISNNPGNSTDARIGVNQNNVYLVWTDDTAGNKDIYFKRSVDNGSTFGSSVNLSNNPGNSTDAHIALYQNNFYLVWTDDTSGNGDIYFKRSVDNGSTFGPAENLSMNNTSLSSGPQISASGNNVYVVWQDVSSGKNAIYYRYSNDTGVGFRGVRELSKTISVNGESALYPQISASGNSVYVAWQDKVSGSKEIFLRGSNDGGNKFTGIKNLSRNNTGDSITPRVASSGNNVFVAWTDSEPGKAQIFARGSTDNGAKFAGIKNVSWSSGRSYDPQIAVGGNNSLYILWEDTSFRKFTFDLVLRASSDMARSFQDKVNLGRYVGEISDYGQIATQGNNVFVVWSDSPISGYPPEYKVFLEASRDNAKSFDDAINLSTGAGKSIEPRIAVSESDRSIFVVWTEITESNSDIQVTKLANFF